MQTDVGAGFPRPYRAGCGTGRGKPAPTLMVALNFQRLSIHEGICDFYASFASLHGQLGILGILLTHVCMQFPVSMLPKLMFLLGEGGLHSMTEGMLVPNDSLFIAVDVKGPFGRMKRGFTSSSSLLSKQTMNLSE